MVVRKKCQTFLGVKISLVGMFSTKSSLDGEELEQQKKTKMKKKRKKVVGKSLWSFSWGAKEVPWVCFMQ